MDEIELLRRFREGLPTAADERRAAARVALLARAEDHPPRPRRVPAWHSRRAGLALAGLGLAAVLIALPVAIFGGSGKVEPAAAQVLRRAAEVAATQPPTVPGPMQFLYTRSKSAYLSATPYLPAGERHPCTARTPCDMTGAPEWSLLVSSEREAWVSLDGSRKGRVREVIGEPRFVSAGQRAGWVAAGKPPLPRAGRVEDSTLSGSEPMGGANLSTDPSALREAIETREGGVDEGLAGEVEVFSRVGDMLRGTYLPSDLRAALYEVAAELTGVELLGRVTDPVGRPGIGVAFADPKDGTRLELIFDPETSALLGERVSMVRSRAYDFEAPPGTTIGYAAYLESKVVDSVGPNPPAGAGAFDNSIGCYEQVALNGAAAHLHGDDPIATCAELWREGVVGLRLRRLEREGKIEERPWRDGSPPLVACTEDGTPALVFPGTGPEVCHRLGLVPLNSFGLPR